MAKSGREDHDEIGQYKEGLITLSDEDKNKEKP